MALLTFQSVVAAGLVPATSAASGGGDTFAPADITDTRTFLWVNNGSGASINVTIVDSGATPAGNAGMSVVVAVAAGAIKLIGIPKGAINSSTGLVSVTYSAVTTVTVAALRV